MEPRIFYQEDCNLSVLEGNTDCNYWLRQPGTCTCTESERIPDVMLSSVCMKAANPGQKQKLRD